MGESTATLPRSSTDTTRQPHRSQSVKNMTTAPRKRRSKDLKKSASARSSLNKESIIPEGESCVPEESPDMNWGKGSSSKNLQGSSSSSGTTATTMDSSSGSMDSSGRRQRRQEKPDMDWGSHAAAVKASKKGMKKSKSDREMGGKGSGHSKKSLGGKGSGHNRRISTRGVNSTTMTKSLSSNALQASRKTLSSSALQVQATTTGRGMGKALSNKDFTKSPAKKDLTKSPAKKDLTKSPAKKKKLNIMSPLLQIMAMDVSYTPNKAKADDHNKTTTSNNTTTKQDDKNKAATFEDMVQIVKRHSGGDSGESSSEEEESDEEVQEFNQDDDSDGEKPKRRSTKGPKKRRQKPTRASEDGKRRSSSSGKQQQQQRRFKRSHTLEEASPRIGGPKRSQTTETIGSTRRLQRSHTLEDATNTTSPRRTPTTGAGLKRSQTVETRRRPVPATPKGRTKARAQSMMIVVKSPMSDDPDNVREKRSRRTIPNIHEETGLVTPRRQGRKSVVMTVAPNSIDLGLATPRRQSRQPTLPACLDLGYGDDDDNNDNDTSTGPSSNRQRKVRRASLGSASHKDHQSQQKESNRRGHGMLGQRDDTLHGLVTPRRTTRKLAAPNPFELEHYYDAGVDEDLDEDVMSSSQRNARARRGHRPAQDPLNVSGRRRGVSKRGSIVAAPPLLDDEEDATGTMDQSDSVRCRGGSRRSLLDTTATSVGATSTQSAGLAGLGRDSVRGRRFDAVDDAAVGRRGISRAGRYGYGEDTQRLCLSAVPSTAKKTVGLAALLYCKPLDLGNHDDKDEDDSTGSPVSVADVEKQQQQDGADDKHPVDKAQAKKDYWKAKLAAGAADSHGSSRGRRP